MGSFNEDFNGSGTGTPAGWTVSGGTWKQESGKIWKYSQSGAIAYLYRNGGNVGTLTVDIDQLQVNYASDSILLYHSADLTDGWIFYLNNMKLYRLDDGVYTAYSDSLWAGANNSNARNIVFTLSETGAFTVTVSWPGESGTPFSTTVTAGNNPYSANTYMGVQASEGTELTTKYDYINFLQPPPVPSGLVGTPASTTQIDLNWDDTTDATSYKVYRDDVQIATPATSNYSDTGRSPGTTYAYKVRAVNSAGESAQTSAINASTSYPVGNASDWNTTFNEVAGTTGLDATAAANVFAGTSGLSLVGALNAYNGTTGLGLNAVCNEIASTSGREALDALRNGVWATAPAAPTLDSVTPGNTELDVVATLGSDGGSAITVVEYRLDGGSWVSSGQATGTFTISELSNGTEYDVEIRAVNSIGPSTGSNLISATPVSPNVNLLTVNQASVETDTTGFSVTSNGTLSASTDFATHGSRSLKVVKINPGQVDVTLTQVTSGIVAGESYTVVADNKCVTHPTASYYFKIYWYLSNGGFISQTTSTAKTYTADWIQNTYTVAAPALAARATIILNIYNPLGNGTYYYDKLGLFQSTDTTWTLPA